MAIQLKPTKPGPLWRFLASVWLGISLMLVTALMAGLGHFFGFKETEEIFFGSWWFSGLMLTLALNLEDQADLRSLLQNAEQSGVEKYHDKNQYHSKENRCLPFLRNEIDRVTSNAFFFKCRSFALS